MSELYRGYRITYNPKPIPTRQFDWDFVHQDYDGAEDANDHRAGSSASLEACKDEIDYLEEIEYFDETFEGLNKDDNDGQPDEAQEWYDFDPDC